MDKITKIEDEFSRKPQLYATLEGVGFVLMVSVFFGAYIVWGRLLKRHIPLGIFSLAKFVPFIARINSISFFHIF